MRQLVGWINLFSVMYLVVPASELFFLPIAPVPKIFLFSLSPIPKVEITFSNTFNRDSSIYTLNAGGYFKN